MKIALALALALVFAPLTNPQPLGEPIKPTPNYAMGVLADQPAVPEAPKKIELSGVASWYDATKNHAWYTRKTQWFKGTLNYAAAGQELRRMIEAMKPGHRYWRKTPVLAKITNAKTGISLIVYITDTCGCYSGTPKDRSDDKIIDLSPQVFQALGVPLGRGIQKVTVELLP
jgi:rare lipoprotein A (peptidoglycan hydrolase)